MLFDAHTHLDDETASPAPFHRLPVATTPEECARLLHVCEQDPLCHFACGVHPWYSDRIAVAHLTPWFSHCRAMGEIGLDRLWCSVDFSCQLSVFRAQLQLAQELSLPIILHSKGYEAEVLAEIQNFSQPILVHWYSCPDHISAYIKLGCYFSIGPDLSENPAVQTLARLVPLNRLCVETDGRAGIAWAKSAAVSAAQLPDILQESITSLAQLRGCSAVQMETICGENMRHFLRL